MEDKGVNVAARPPGGSPAETGSLTASSLPLLLCGAQIVGFIHFVKVLVQCEMQTALFGIWTYIINSISMMVTMTPIVPLFNQIKKKQNMIIWSAIICYCTLKTIKYSVLLSYFAKHPYIHTPHYGFKLIFLLWFHRVLWHINNCRLFNAKSSLYIYIKNIWFGLLGFMSYQLL